jgi:tetratricopeptide (TPR) repeat protein
MTLAQMESRFFELKGKLAVGQLAEDEFKREMENLRFQDHEGKWWMIGAQSGRWYYYDGTRWLLGQPDEPSGNAYPLTPRGDEQSSQPGAGQRASAARLSDAPLDGRRQTADSDRASAAVKAPYYIPPPQTLASSVPAASGPTTPSQPTAAAVAGGGSQQTSTAKAPSGLAPRTQDVLAHAPTLGERLREDVAHVHMPSVHVPPMHVPSVHAPPVHVQVHTPAPIRRYSPYAILFGAIAGGLVLVALMWLAVDNLVPGKPISSFFGSSLGIGPSAAATNLSGRSTPIAGANVDDLLSVADDLISKSQVDSALAQYQTASKLAPNNADVYVRWARALALAGRIQEAITTAQRATHLDPNSSEAYAELARALAWSGQNDAAISAGEKAVALDPKNAAAHALLAEAYLRAGKQTEAEREATAAVNDDDSNPDGHRAMGWVALIAGQKDAALTEWQRVVQIAPGVSFFHFEFGQVYGFYLNDPADAVPQLQAAIQLYPPYVPSYIALGGAYLSQNQPGPAILQYQKALTYDPNSNDAYVGLGLAFQKQGRCQQAIPYFQKSLELNPNASAALRGLSDCGALAKGQPTPAAVDPTAVGIMAVPTAYLQATVAPLGASTPVPQSQAAVSSTGPTGEKGAGQIAFSIYDGQYHLYIANTDGSNRHLLTELASNPSFSPDGSQLLFTSWDPSARGIHRIEVSGAADRQISLRTEDFLASWSPDGTRYVYATRAGIGADITKRAYTIRISDPTAKATQDPPPFVERAQYPVWGPDNRIVFRDCGFPTDTCGLAVINADGSGKIALVPNMNATAPAWSRDGKLVVYTSDYGGNWDIYVVNSKGGSPARLTTDPAEDGLPTFSPDGKQIAFLSHRDGTWAIWAMGIDGSKQHKLFDLGGDPAGTVPGNSPAQPGQVWYEQSISWH